MSSIVILIRWRVQRLKKERKGLDEIDTRSYRLRRRLKLRLRLRLRKEKKRYWGRVNNESPWVRRGGPMLISSLYFIYVKGPTSLCEKMCYACFFFPFLFLFPFSPLTLFFARHFS